MQRSQDLDCTLMVKVKSVKFVIGDSALRQFLDFSLEPIAIAALFGACLNRTSSKPRRVPALV